MKRIVCILSAVLFSVGLVSCGYFIDVSDLGVKDNYDAYYLTVDCHLYIQNKLLSFLISLFSHLYTKLSYH